MRKHRFLILPFAIALLVTNASNASAPYQYQPYDHDSFTSIVAPSVATAPPPVIYETFSKEVKPRTYITIPEVDPKVESKVQSKPKQVAVPPVRSPLGVKAAARIAKSYARSILSSVQYDCLYLLWRHESGWRYNAQNSSSGAYGIPQALPGSKMASVASDWRYNPITQVKWGLGYIHGRYGTPCSAWGFFQRNSWY